MAIIDGKQIAQMQLKNLQKDIFLLRKKGIIPGLSVIIVGENPASMLYVSNKEKKANELGIAGNVYRLSQDCSQEQVIKLIRQLNADKTVHGILLQLPLPAHLDAYAIMQEIAPEKDVDGLTSINTGNLLLQKPGIIPCTPKGILLLIKSTKVDITGKHAVIVGRSQIVGRPMAILLLNENATVTLCHSYTNDLGALTRQADILVCAVGSARLIKADMIKKDAIVIDVGNSYLHGKLTGDVDYEEAKKIASFITPVPGGVGPMTIAMLMHNTIEAAGRCLNNR